MEISKMSSLKGWVKDFVLNRIVPLLPSPVLCWYFDKVMRPRALFEINLLHQKFLELIFSERDSFREKSSKWIDYPTVVCMSGLPQVGKTTFANSLMEKIVIFHLDSNVVRGWLIDEGRNYDNINAIVLSFMEEVLKSNNSIIMDSDNFLPGKRAFVNALVKRNGARIKIVYLEVDHSVWWNRLHSPDFYIHRMYADGVVRNNEGYFDRRSIPRSRIIKCVIGEYSRQNPGHFKYRKLLDECFVVENNSQIKNLEMDAWQIAKQLLS